MNTQQRMSMNNPLEILVRSAVDSFRPKMLALTLFSVAAAVIFWILVIWLSIDPLVNLAISALSFVGFDMDVPPADEFFLLGALKSILVPLAVFGFLWPIVASSAVLLAGLYVTPPVVKYLAGRDYPDLEQLGEAGTIAGLWVTLKATLVFLLGWVVTLPLWLIPGMALVLPILLTAYLLISVMRFDSLAEHATKKELKLIKKRDSTSAWVVGVVCAVLSFIPPILLIMPVMSALAFTHHYLNHLRTLRASRVIEHDEE
ncbi:MAG: EI24 domain-containing protein [Limnobacter sp.]|nr:EI24 domain-containing protein [Limnobacter sp.]